MKTAWRHTKRESEGHIYSHLRSLGVMGTKGIAEFIDREDLRTGLCGNVKITVNSLRPAEARLDPDDDIVLHRIILGSVGEPLWKFKTLEQFLHGILAILSGPLP